jgi:hypothetical protein
MDNLDDAVKAVAQERIGDALRAQGNLPAALDAYKAFLAIAERHAEADPGHAGYQRNLSATYWENGPLPHR